jgi:hypothetical protein
LCLRSDKSSAGAVGLGHRLVQLICPDTTAVQGSCALYLECLLTFVSLALTAMAYTNASIYFPFPSTPLR